MFRHYHAAQLQLSARFPFIRQDMFPFVNIFPVFVVSVFGYLLGAFGIPFGLRFGLFFVIFFASIS